MVVYREFCKSLKEEMAAKKSDYLHRVLKEAKGNVSLAAEILEMDERNLWHDIRKLGLCTADYRSYHLEGEYVPQNETNTVDAGHGISATVNCDGSVWVQVDREVA